MAGGHIYSKTALLEPNNTMLILIYGRRPYLLIDGSSGAAMKTDSSKLKSERKPALTRLLGISPIIHITKNKANKANPKR
jgi:hypothetical protein